MNHELLFFFQSVLWGAALLFFYDILRIGRRLFPRRVFLVSVEDLLYWIFAGILLFGRIYQANEGRLRGYSIVAVVLGKVIYTYSISGRFATGMAASSTNVPAISLSHASPLRIHPKAMGISTWRRATYPYSRFSLKIFPNGIPAREMPITIMLKNVVADPV